MDATATAHHAAQQQAALDALAAEAARHSRTIEASRTAFHAKVREARETCSERQVAASSGLDRATVKKITNAANPSVDT